MDCIDTKPDDGTGWDMGEPIPSRCEPPCRAYCGCDATLRGSRASLQDIEDADINRCSTTQQG